VRGQVSYSLVGLEWLLVGHELLVIFEIEFYFMRWPAWTLIFLFVLSHVAGMTVCGSQLHPAICWDGVFWTFCLGCPQATVLPDSYDWAIAPSSKNCFNQTHFSPIMTIFWKDRCVLKSWVFYSAYFHSIVFLFLSPSLLFKPESLSSIAPLFPLTVSPSSSVGLKMRIREWLN
jgi:hypothetical protein